jgi:hypothetical protein
MKPNQEKGMLHLSGEVLLGEKCKANCEKMKKMGNANSPNQNKLFH